MIKILILILCFSCSKENISKTIYLNKTQKIKVQGNWNSKYNISYLWSKPQGPNSNDNSKWVVNKDIMLFTPSQVGNYIITVSIENNMGEVLGEELFYYNVINPKNKSANLNNNATIAKTNHITMSKPSVGHTIQVSSWNLFEDAKKHMNYLNNHGFDAYIQKININSQIWYRVRVGKNLSYDKCSKIIKQLNKYIEKNMWIDKYVEK
tara:strand:+ start:227 stop:850 length:624 start_codon:yes stop_codon:yes gene_type:complete